MLVEIYVLKSLALVHKVVEGIYSVVVFREDHLFVIYDWEISLKSQLGYHETYL